MVAEPRPVKVAIYGRVSTKDKDQNPATQLLPLRDFVVAQGWPPAAEFVDQAPAGDLAARTAWRQLLDAASHRRVDLLLLWRLDRGFRSVLDAAQTLERLRAWGVGLRSYQEPWVDTTSPFGEALYYITAAYAQLERAVLAERVRAGMARAARDGVRIGRPRAVDRPGFAEQWARIEPELAAGRVSQREVARQLRIGVATVDRLLKVDPKGEPPAGSPGEFAKGRP
ncbi:MAG: recombinase family protein [Candidatus Dormibacteria bacterium]